MTRTGIRYGLLLGMAAWLVAGSALASNASVALGPQQPDDLALGSLPTVYDPDGSLDAHAALQALRQSPQRTDPDGDTPLGFFHGAHWFLLTLDTRQAREPWLLHGGRPHTDHLDFFAFDSNDNLVTVLRQGDQVPRDKRPYHGVQNVFPLQGLDGRFHVVLRVTSMGSVQLPLRVTRQLAFERQRNSALMANGLLYGVLLALVLYNAFLFVAVRDRSYFYYVSYLSVFTVFLLARDGYLTPLWPQTPALTNTLQAATPSLGIALFFVFLGKFLAVQNLSVAMQRGNQLIIAVCTLSGIVAGISSPVWVFDFMSAFIGVVMVATFLAVTGYAVRGYRPARLLFPATVAPTVMGVVFLLANHGHIGDSWLVDNSLKLGATIEGLLLSMALGYRFAALKEENESILRNARLELERKVTERTQDLHAALRARDEFFAMMSHEVRTPLNGILGTVDILGTRLTDADNVRDLEIIERSGNTLLDVINDVLDYSRIESGRMPVKQEPFNLMDLVENVAALFSSRAAEKGTQIHIAVALDNPLVLGDATRVRQVLQNLVSNAVKFTEQGSVTVRVRREGGGTQVRLEVEDTGPGIASHQHKAIFEAFKQLEEPTHRRHGGSGLGLAICRELVRLMQGDIGLDSEPGRGSRFWLTLPLPPSLPGDAPERVIEEPLPLASQHLLVVDDNQINLTVTEALARQLGHDVTAVDSAEAALAALDAQPAHFDAVLMDCEMPGMDGFQATRAIGERIREGKLRHLPVIALSAYVTPDKVAACYESGMVAHIAKPLKKEVLQRTLAQVLGASELSGTQPSLAGS